MCGICGLVADDPSELPTAERLEAAAELLRHRGPDDWGAYFSPREPGPAAALAHRRLSIIDLDGGKQPMSNEDGSVWVSFNGEIYNFPSLQKELEASGHQFRTRSDTEVLVHAYEEYGEQFITRLRGMFAFALWDERERRLLLARDRLGQKPLYYARKDGLLAFASQPKAIFAMADFERRIDPQALDAYLTYQYVPHPRSIYRDLNKLPPAHYLVYQEGNLKLERYWQIDASSETEMTEEEACERVREGLRESVKMRMVSEVPLGGFLSGGIDSSIVVGLMAEASSRPVETFSIGFEEPEFDELAHARAVAERFGTSHHELVVRPKALEILPALADHFDEPFGDSSAIPCYYLAEMTRRHVTVALSGDAGDECFAGYRRYRAVKLAALLDRLPAPVRRLLGAGFWQKLPSPADLKSARRQLRRMLAGLALPERERYFHWMAIFSDAARHSLYTPEFRERVNPEHPFGFLDRYYEEAGSRDFVSAAAYADLHTYLPGDLLTKVDVSSMAHSLEARAPFLDHPLVELAASLPSRMKLRGRQGKYILKRAFADLLPPDILRRRKMGFGVPIARWFRGELKEFVSDALLNGSGIRDGYFAEGAVRGLLEEHVQEKQDHCHRLWALLMFELWAGNQAGCQRPPQADFSGST